MRIPACLAVLLASLVVACDSSPSGTGDPDPDPDPGPEPDPACVDAALGSSSAEPFDRVALTGIDGLDEASYAGYETESGATGLTAVAVAEDGSAELLVPPNAGALMEAGTVAVAVHAGDAVCEGLALDVRPLPAATGDPLADVVAAVDELTAQLAGQFGLDTGTVAATGLAELPPQAVPVALLLEAREHFDPAGALGGLSDDERAFTQAALAKLGLAEALETAAAGGGELSQPAPTAGRPPSAGSDAGAVSGAAAAGAGAGTGSQGWRSGAGGSADLAADCGNLGVVPPDHFDLGGPAALSDYIKAARSASGSLGPLGEGISSVGNAFAVMGLAVPAVGTIFGVVAFTTSLVQQMRAHLYPSAISRLEYQLDPVRIPEDWDTDRGDPEIRWSFAKLWATNDGMGLSRVGFDLIATTASINPGLKGALGTGADVADIAAKDALNSRLDELGSSEDCWSVGPTEFGPVVVDDDTGEDWVTAGIIEGDAVHIDPDDVRRIHPRRVGEASLRVVTRTEPFPGPFGFEDKPVEVLRKEVVWIPSTLLVEDPGETMEVKFRVDNARHYGPGDIDIEPGPGIGVTDIVPSDNVYTLRVETPSDRESYPTTITAYSTSTELPPPEPERKAILDVFAVSKVEISPREGCVAAGDTLGLTATASGPENPTVLWEIEAGEGSLSVESGESVTYSAPGSGSGTAVIRAYLEEEPDVEDRVEIRYGACSGLAVYHGEAAEISFPFSSPGQCDNPELDREYVNETLPEDGAQPLVPPDPADVWIGRSETFEKAFAESGTFGRIPEGQDNCVTAGFTAEAGYDGTLTGSADGTRVDVDIATWAESNCQDAWPDRDEQCAGAVGFMGLTARYDFDIAGAASYRLRMDLTCDAYVPPGFPPTNSITVTVVRVEPDGTFLPPNATTAPIERACDGTPIDVDHVFEFAAPAEDGQVDHVMVLFSVNNASIGAIPDISEGRHTGHVDGYVSIAPE